MKNAKPISSTPFSPPSFGAQIGPDGQIQFSVWAPHVREIELVLDRKGVHELIPMVPSEKGVFAKRVSGVGPGQKYGFRLNRKFNRPDPYSRFQPDGVHGLSQVVDPLSFKWSDRSFKNFDLGDYLIYEAHIGTFTSEGNFEAVIKKIPHLKKMGINCFEIMPIAQFPGRRNWGYDGVDPYAIQNSYGGPTGLKKLVNALHRAGIAVCLDVVYNHIGPEGNYLQDFGPYFTQKYKTPWGPALNYDDGGSDFVRRYIIENALYWLEEYHIDALRLDAIHGIWDFSAKHLLEEMKEAVETWERKSGRRAYLIAESDLNDVRYLQPRRVGGYNLDAQWADDFHHAVHRGLTRETSGYYADFLKLGQIGEAIKKGFVYDGIFSEFRNRRFGNSARDLPGNKFVFCTQNHDQIGNRPLGDRQTTLTTESMNKLGLGLLMTTPSIPLVFMGQEYGEKAPFQYFVDHGDPGLIKSVRQGRKNEFKSFGWREVADPADPKTFQRSRLNWKLTNKKSGREFMTLFRDLAALRKKIRGRDFYNKRNVLVFSDEASEWIVFQYRSKGTRWAVLANFSSQVQKINWPFRVRWFKEKLNTDLRLYGGNSKLRPALKTDFITMAPQSLSVGQIG